MTVVRKLGAEQIAALLDAFDHWQRYDFATRTADEVAESFGVRKETMYRYVRDRKRAGLRPPPPDRYVELERRVAALEQFVDELRSTDR